ncbi:serine--tRNA ligase [Bacteroidetes/Chlorobi group bacterium Naka2016]|jgi:seryl-tRNA synthetase|nr:MAG: serine--tRNA ligase [Bacteroidetes/Chlorobi group bacterium Naka2016]
MLDLKFIRENPELVRKNIELKGENANIDFLLELDENRRKIIAEVERLKHHRNVVSNEIARLKKEKQDATAKIEEMRVVSDQIKAMDDELREIETKIRAELLKIPNMLHRSVPAGKDSNDNVVVRAWGNPLEKDVPDHIQISKALNILDFERGAKVTGSGFAYYIGKGAALERALITYMLEKHIYEHNYLEMLPPLVVNENAMIGTGQIPKLADDMYYIDKDELYLIPTAEVPVTNYHSNEVLNIEDLPKKFVAYTPCFRREAGSYGKETKGFLRVHQFNKVELVKYTTPETSYEELELLTKDAESILQDLNIPYRVVLLCSGDTSFSSAKTYDIEVWSPAEKKWLEVSSCSNFEDFQARRANIRFKRTPNDKPEFVHTLNGSGLATSRLIVALLENYYNPEDGSVTIPEVLRQYTKFEKITK